jgi:hypothetical protein
VPLDERASIRYWAYNRSPNYDHPIEKILAWLVPKHFARNFVFPESKKNRLTETIIPRPFREFDLADHHRFDPMATCHFGSSQPLIPPASASRRKVKKGTFFNLNFVQIRVEITQKFFVKPVPTLPANLSLLPS